MKQLVKGYFFLLSVAAIIVTVDQVSKAYIRSHLALAEMWSPWDWLTPYARIVNWQNTGVAFGMFQGQGNIFTILAIVVAAAIIYYYPRLAPNDWLLRVAMCLQLGGALGNLVDRLTQGYVTDFISVGTFPVFNVADSSITVGVIVLILAVWIQEKRQKEEAQHQALALQGAEAERGGEGEDESSSPDHRISG